MKHKRPDRLIASLAVEALLHEAITGPKPGLVDRFNNGSHDDMDLFTFCSSASVLHPHFQEMAAIGQAFKGDDLTELLAEIRPIGMEAEEDMLLATNGVNTHKGLIFSLGIISAAAGYLWSERKEKITGELLCSMAALMCVGIVERELKSASGETNGEKLYLTSGTTGIRGEAEAGFPSVINFSLPILRKSNNNWNVKLIEALLYLMKEVEDSNVLHRGGSQALEHMKKMASEALGSGGAVSPDGNEILRQMDLDLTERNISPGGCADLLALTIFLFRLENHFNSTDKES